MLKNFKTYVIALASLAMFSATARASSPLIQQLKASLHQLSENIGTLIPPGDGSGPSALATGNMSQNCQIANHLEDQMSDAMGVAQIALSAAHAEGAPIAKTLQDASNTLTAAATQICSYAATGADPSVGGQNLDIADKLTQIKNDLDAAVIVLGMF